LLLQAGDRGGTVDFGSGIAWHEYALTQVVAVTRYAWLVVWPYPLVFDHGTTVIRDWGEIAPRSVVLLALVAWLLLVPNSSVLPVATQTVAEHRMYAPLGALLTLAIEPSAMTHANLGIALLRAGNEPEALTHLRTALSLDPGYEPARRALERTTARDR
jgi:hypothetical protein